MMMRTVCSLLFGLSFSIGSVAQAESLLCANDLRREPVVMWDVTGYTIAGTLVHGALAVYNDGMASVSSLNTGDIRTEALAPGVVQGLRSNLIQAGATTLCDQNYVAADLPLTTLTMFEGSTDAQAHTFSYWVAENAYSHVQAEIDDFLATHFAGFSVY